MKAVANVNDLTAPKLIGMDVSKQTGIDNSMVEALDGTTNEWGWRKARRSIGPMAEDEWFDRYEEVLLQLPRLKKKG